MVGGAEADVFDFDALGDLGSGATRDVIEDFSTAGDTIDLADVDANSLVGGNQAFQLIGPGQFTGVAGQLRALTNNGGNTITAADTDGGGSGNIQIQLNGAIALSASSFIL
jgi:hypothetical protein